MSRHAEIFDGAGYDCRINQACTEPEQAKKLYTILQQGFPAHWRPYSHLDKKSIQYYEAVGERIPKNFLWVDNEDDPVFLIKEKRMRDKKNVFHELKIAPLITRIIATPDAQKIAHDHGFDQLRFVEPLLAWIHQPTQQQYTGYPYIHGDTYHRSRPPMVNLTYKIEEETTVIDPLKTLFRKEGILPRDLWISQFIASSAFDPIPNTLFLIDVEAYEQEIR